MSTAEHPQTDGQAEAAVKVIQKLLKPFVFQGQDWEELLHSLEFAYNDTTKPSTDQTPFLLYNYGILGDKTPLSPFHIHIDSVVSS